MTVTGSWRRLLFVAPDVRVRLVFLILTFVIAACGGAVASVSPSPSGPAARAATPAPTPAAPRVLGTTASEAKVTITYDRPMKHGLACGTRGFVAGPANTIDALEMNMTTRYYGSADPDFDEFWSHMWVAELNGDCSAVTFTFVHGMAPGTYPLRIVKVQDQAGRPLASDPTIVTVTIAETAPPVMQLVQQWQDKAIVQFSEPIKKALAIDPTRYRMDGLALPAGSTVECLVTSCAAVQITLPAPRAAPPKTITVVGLEDLAGKPFASGTDTHEIDPMAGQSR